MGGSPSKDVMRSRDWNGAGRVAIVTGPTGTGIGLHTARWLAERGCHVVLAGRSEERLAECEKQIRAVSKHADGTAFADVQLTSIPLNLGSLASVETFAEKFKALNLPLHLLINNAGIMATPYQHTVDGLEIQFGTNVVAHHHLTNLLMDNLKASAPSRVVNVASMAHKMASKLKPDNLEAVAFHPTEKAYGAWSAYGNSKLGNILHARALNKRYSADGVTAYSLHPGVVATELGRQGLATRFFYSAFAFTMKTAEEGAGTTLWCATSDEALASAGKYHDVCADASAAGTHRSRDDTLADAMWDLTETEIRAWKAKPALSVEVAAMVPAALEAAVVIAAAESPVAAKPIAEAPVVAAEPAAAAEPVIAETPEEQAPEPKE